MNFAKSAIWKSPTGASLFVNIEPAKGKAHALIHINHGLAEYAARYARMAKTLSKAGFHVVAHDHRGHGHTTAPDAPRSVFGAKGWQSVLEDMHFVNSEVRRFHPELPIIIFGHSMGAILVQNYLLQWPDSIDAAAIWNGAGVKSAQTGLLKAVLTVERALKGPYAPSIVTGTVFGGFNKAFKPNQTSADWLTKDPVEAKAYEDDPDCGWPASQSMWRALADGITFGAKGKGIETISKTLPLFLLGGDADPSVDKGRSILSLAKQYETAGLTNIKITIRTNGRHEAHNEPRPERDQVLESLIDWAKSAISD